MIKRNEMLPRGLSALLGGLLLAGIGCSDGTGIGIGKSPQNNGTREAPLTGAEEVPPVATRATGRVTATLNGNELRVTGEFSGLESDLQDVSGSPAHVHDAPLGEAGPIVFNLQVESDDGRSGTFSGTHELTDEQRQAFLAGRWYVNVHTADHPMGEIRGQLEESRPEPLRFTVDLTGDEEVPPVSTPATGSVEVLVLREVMTLVGTVEGLTSDLQDVSGSPAHVHEAPRGENGPIIFNIETTPGTDARGATLRFAGELTQAQLGALRAQRWYVNVHTVANPEGEIRGQLVSDELDGAPFEARLRGDNEVPPVETEATGSAEARLVGSTLTVSGSFEGLSSDLHEVSGSPAHVHAEAIGANGPIIVPLEVTPGADNRSGTFQGEATLTPEQATQLLSNGMYVNVHSVDHPEGEIRGQLLLVPLTPETVNVALRGEEEVPPVETDATGTTTATLDGSTLRVSCSFAGLGSDLTDVQGSSAHVHRAGAGEAGPIVFNLEVDEGEDRRSGTCSGESELTDADVQNFVDGRLYVNVHTVDHPTGEIRGQLVQPAPSTMSSRVGTKVIR